MSGDRPPVCVVIGAGDGLGAAIARAFAREGLAVCVTRQPRHVEALEMLANSIRAEGGQAHALRPQRGRRFGLR